MLIDCNILRPIYQNGKKNIVLSWKSSNSRNNMSVTVFEINNRSRDMVDLELSNTVNTKYLHNKRLELA